MKLFLLTVTLLAGAWAQTLSGEYLPPVEEATNVVETNFLENEPAHSLADDGYRYKTVRRFRFRHRRDVSELSNEYLPPAASAPGPAYSSYESAPVASYSAPAASYAAPAAESYEVEASAPAHSFSSDDGYRYRSVKRYRLRRRRRDVSELSNEYLPPAASAPGPSYSSYESAPVASYSAPAASYAAPAAESYEVEASAPAHSFSSDDGYRYRSVKRYRLRRRRRDVSELSNEYLPPAASAPGPSYSSFESAPVASYSAPAASYAAPAAESYEVEASAPAHSFSSDDGYRYRSVKRYRLRRRRRDVSELSNEYLPPAASAPGPSYSSYESAPVASYSAPAVNYAAPAAESYEVEASAPAHSFSSDDGYRYRSVKRYRLRRRRRDVSELSNEYLPPAASAPGPSYSSFESAPVASYSAPAASYAAPAAESYEVEASAPAHSFSSDDGYRYRSVKRYRLRRRRRDVSELSNEYLPPAASAPGPSYTSYASAPVASYSAPAASYSAPAASYGAPTAESYQVEASAPAHTLAEDGYRYKTVKRYRLRRRF